MAILVTGAMGHVGYEAVRCAAAAGHSVIAHYRNAFREADARDAGGGVTWVCGDLTDADSVERLVDAHKIDRCIHSAAVPNDKFILPDPLAAIHTNITGTTHLLEAARKQGWQQFIFVSTGSVFQRWADADKPIPENAPTSPVSLYGTTKHAGELLTASYGHHFGLSAATVRISWVYGPPMVPRVLELSRGPIPNLLRAAMRGEPLHFDSGGDFAASFTHVRDVAAGLVAAVTAETMQHGVYHLGSGENYSAVRVAAAIKAVIPEADLKLGPGTLPWTQFSVMRGPLACERMQAEFGFEPAISLESGIAQFVDWMRNNPASYAD